MSFIDYTRDFFLETSCKECQQHSLRYIVRHISCTQDDDRNEPWQLSLTASSLCQTCSFTCWCCCHFREESLSKWQSQIHHSIKWVKSLRATESWWSWGNDSCETTIEMTHKWLLVSVTQPKVTDNQGSLVVTLWQKFDRDQGSLTTLFALKEDNRISVDKRVREP